MSVKPQFLIERQGKKAVLYAGLLDAAHEDGLQAITTALIQAPTPDNAYTAIVHATVVTNKGTFTGLGDANPDNVARFVAPHAIRMAETRAKARALRDAINVGVVAVEELGDDDDDRGHAPPPRQQPRQLPSAEQYAALKQQRERLGWSPQELVAQIGDPLKMSPDQLAEAINELAVRAPGR